MTSTLTLTVSVITASFPTIVLTPISTATNPPTYATLRAAQTQLNANAASIPSHGGDGLHGHIVLTLATPDYAALSTITILTGIRSGPTSLWHLHLPSPTTQTCCNLTINDAPTNNNATTHSANSVIPQNTIADRIAFYHTTMFSPSLST